jgi:fatty acid desaturase
LMHGQLIGFHEASHSLLRKSKRLNEFDGQLLGVFSLLPFTLYRASHQTHHMYLGTERDEEFWPFVDTKKPRWVRVLAAVAELTCGMIFTPLVFLRSFLRKGSPIRSKRIRSRIWREYALIVVAWATVLAVMGWLHLWTYFFWMYLGPAFIASNLQSWRKYVEHVGLTGTTIRSATRSIVSRGWGGKVVAFTLLHEPYHGVHHQRVKLTHAELPQHAADLEPQHPDEIAPFPSYRSAIWHLLRCLADPRVGPQWRGKEMEEGVGFET